MNNELEEFLAFVEEQNQQEQKNNYSRSRLYKLLPEPFYKTVQWHIRTHFNNDIEAYCNSIPNFFQVFNVKFKSICEDLVIYSRKKDRRRNRIRKHTLLHCAFLLKLTGRKGQKIVPKLILDEYLYDQAQQEEFCKQARLMDYTGRIAKLTSPKCRREQRNAQNYNVAKLYNQLMIDKGFTFAFITITLPPHMHPNPVKGKNSYKGASPKQMLDKLSGFIELIRSHLHKRGLIVSEDFYGIHVLEGQSDGTGHKHMMVYIHPDNLHILKDIVDGIVRREKLKISKETGIEFEKVKYFWDFKVNNGSASSHSYLFKYICPDINDKETARNEAFRSYSGGRAIQFFGVKNKLSTFNHLIKHWKNYALMIEDKDIVEMLETKDLIAFHTKYSDRFSNVNIDGKFIGVAYHASTDKQILIEKKQFILIEEYDKSKAVLNHPSAMQKQSNYNEVLLGYYKEQKTKGIDVYCPISECYFSESSSNVINDYMKEQIDLGKCIFDRSLENTNDLDNILKMEVILVHHYSRKNASHFSESEKPPALQSETV